MASHHRGGGRGGGRGHPNPNAAQGGYGGGRGGGRGGLDYGGRGGGGGGYQGGRGGGDYQGGRGGYQGGRGEGGGRGGGGGDYQGGRGGYQGGGRGGGGGYQGGRGGYQGGRGEGGDYQGGGGAYHGGRGGYQGGRGDGGGVYQGGRGDGGGRGGGYHQGGRDGGGGRGRGGYYQGGRDGGGGRGRGGFQEGRGGGFQGRGGRGGYDYGRGDGQQGGGRGGSSQSIVRRQAGPPVADRYKPSEELLEKFKAMDIHRGTPMFPARPGYGAAGTPCLVIANHFFVGLVDQGLHHYDVTITPESALKGVYRKVMAKLVAEHQQTELGGRLPAYDGSKSLFTAGELPFKSKEFDVTLNDRRQTRYKVAIKHATAVSLEQLMMLMAGYATDIPMQALQVLDIVLRDIVLNERQEMGYLAVGRSFFSPVIESPTTLGNGVEGWKGFYQSIRPTQNGLSVVIDISSTAFIRSVPLIDFVREILGKKPNDNFTRIPDLDLGKVNRALRGVKIEVTHRGDQRRKYKIAGLTPQLTRHLTFEASPGVSKTVVEYFRETYGLNLQYVFLPCVQVGSEQRPNYLPMEVCKIVPGQRYQKKLDETQVKVLRESICQKPDKREQSICQIVEHNQYNNTRRANEFGIEVDYNPTLVQARVLPAPTLKYFGSETCCPEGGSWNMIRKKVADAARVKNWACVNFCYDLKDYQVEDFCSQLVRICQNSGVDIRDTRLPIMSADRHQPETELQRIYQIVQSYLRGQKLDLLLAILPRGNGSLYGTFKRICETEIGLMTQCCLQTNVQKWSTSTFANIALKINAKVGGRNTVLVDPLPVVSNKTTIIFGADVTHPSALDDTAPSIASVVASLDWPQVVKYNGVYRAQGHRVEIINGLEDIVKELLLAFENGQGEKPQQLIFYRDGVSEGQFKQVLEQEIPEIEKAWKALYSEKPRITFIIVQKRHHTRLFPSEKRPGNVLPGTVVDRNICHPTEFDFFLCSHAGIIGTSRPTHYHVLRDDNMFTADSLQSLTYNLCYTYSSCTRSVSIAPPAYYAHKLASRARMYLPQASDAASVSSHASSAQAATPRQLPAVRDELKRFMFYC